jgi:hypothetical protein
MCIATAKNLSEVIVTCMCHNINVLCKGVLSKATLHFNLDENEFKKLLEFITFARKGFSKEDLKSKVIIINPCGSSDQFIGCFILAIYS